VRCHDDEIAAPIRRRCNDGFIELHVLHMNRIAGHTGLLGRISHPQTNASTRDRVAPVGPLTGEKIPWGRPEKADPGKFRGGAPTLTAAS